MPEQTITGEHDVIPEVARNIEDLPELGEDSIRVVHITTGEQAEEILQKGLDYAKHGMAMSTARAWSNPDDVEYHSADPRFSGPGLKAVVLDMSNAEWKLHNRVGKAPGKIPSLRVVGIVDSVPGAR